MIPDVILEKGEWCDVNTLSGIPIGSDLMLINKGTATVFIWVGDDRPEEDSINGIPLTEFHPTATLSDETETVWAKAAGYAKGRLYVEKL